MKIFWIIFALLATIFLFLLLVSYVCFYLAFYVPPKKQTLIEEYPIPRGKIYEPFRDTFVGWMKELETLPYEKFSIKSFDGLTLCGRFYEYEPGAPIELMFHGYRGSAKRDLCGGVQRCFSLKRSALIVDQRTSGDSEGHVITFGIKEHRDCLDWVDFMIKHFGSDVRIILTGISMGAATALMASGKELPPNVIGILADCGYTSPKQIIKKVIRQIHLPADLLYPFVKLGAKLFGHFDLEAFSAIEEVAKCKIPIIFFHGESDDFVPCEMSRQNYDACKSTKRLFTVPGAGHGLSYPVNPESYLSELKEFFEPFLVS